MTEDNDVATPVVTNPPKRIWLNVGDIDSDYDFDEWSPVDVAFLQADRDRLAAEVEGLRNVYNAARGLCHGYDWNAGHHAKLYRGALVNAVHAIAPLPDMAGHAALAQVKEPRG